LSVSVLPEMLALPRVVQPESGPACSGAEARTGPAVGAGENADVGKPCGMARAVTEEAPLPGTPAEELLATAPLVGVVALTSSAPLDRRRSYRPIDRPRAKTRTRNVSPAAAG